LEIYARAFQNVLDNVRHQDNLFNIINKLHTKHLQIPCESAFPCFAARLAARWQTKTAQKLEQLVKMSAMQRRN